MADSKADLDERMCQPCLYKDVKRTADVFCSTCNEFQCTDCSKNHTVYSFMKNHEVLRVKENKTLLSSTKTKKVDMKGLGICNKHNERLRFYCGDHKALICSTCAFVHHRKCDNAVAIENIAKQGQCDELRNVLKTVIATTKQSVENLKEATSCLSLDVQQMPERLNKMKENFVKMFDDFAKNVTEDAKTYRDKTTANWTEKMRECENYISEMNKSLDTIEDSISNDTAFEQFIIERSISDAVKKLTNEAGAVCADLKVLNVACSFEKRFEELKASMMSTLTSNEFNLNYNIPRRTKLELIKSIDLQQTSADVYQPFYSGLDFLPDGRLVVVDNTNGKCLIYDENLKLLSSYRCSCDDPLSVCAVSNETIAITSGGNLMLNFLHVSDTNEVTLNRKCVVQASCDSPNMKDDKDCVVGCYDDAFSVSMVSPSGEEKTFDNEFPSKEYSDDNILYIYDIKTVENIDMKDTLIKKLCDVDVGPCDHVFVCSEDTKSIVEITSLAVSNDQRRLAIYNATADPSMLTLYKLTSE